jgi:hypothetical protein
MTNNRWITTCASIASGWADVRVGWSRADDY